MNRTNLKNNKSEKDKSGKGQFWNWNILKREILNRKHLKKDGSEKDKSEKG